MPAITLFADIDTLQVMLDAWPNVYKMLCFRGYDVSSIKSIISGSALNSLCLENNGFVMKATHSVKKPIVVIFNPDKKIGIDVIRDVYCPKLKQDEINHVIILNKTGPTPYTSKEIKKSIYSHLEFEFFTYLSLGYCVMEHKLQPYQVCLTEQERQDLLKKTSDKQLPGLPVTDAVAKFMNWKKGNIIKYIECNGSQEKNLYYRVVK